MHKKPPENTLRLDSVDCLRAIAALMVVGYHAAIFFFGLHGHELPLLFKALTAGDLGVPIFIVLSGFCLALPFLKKSDYRIGCKSFALRRALRILPPYYLVMLPLAAVTLTPMYSQMRGKDATDLADVLYHVFLVHNLFAENIWRISAQFWSIALEGQLYVLFPLLMLTMRRPWITAGIAVAAAIPWWGYGFATRPELVSSDMKCAFWYSVVSILPLFAAGMIAADVLVKGTRMPQGFSLAGLALVLGGLVIKSAGIHPLLPILGVGLGTALLLAAIPVRPLERALDYRPLVKTGQVSYTLYLIHMPILGLLGHLIGKRLEGTPLLIAAAASCVFVTLISFPVYKLIEEPFIRMHTRFGRGKPKDGAPLLAPADAVSTESPIPAAAKD